MTTVLSALNEALHQAMDEDPRVVLLGEDILDPYGGAFKVARGLSSRFPGRVLTTPISELAITGIGAGFALRGMRPVVEIMFGDFLGLAFDQFLNHACKYRWMYNGQVRVPMVLRTPMGGRRGYGPTHSQTIEKHFLGMPGLTVIAPNALSDPKELLLRCIRTTEDPVLFIENKALYTVALRGSRNLSHLRVHVTDSAFPSVVVRVNGAPDPSVTLAAYGYGVELALEAQWRLAIEQEIFVELVAPTLISPLDWQPLLNSTKRTGRLVTIEEGGLSFGWGSEVISALVERSIPLVAKRVAAQDACIPASKPLESQVLPSVQDICNAVVELSENRAANQATATLGSRA